MAIRPVWDDDIAAIAAITNYYITTSAIHFAYEPVPESQILGYWKSHRDRFPWLVIEDAGQVVGFAKSGTWRDRAAYAWTAETGVYLADGARGRGLGRRVYLALLDELARRGFRSAVAGITLPNDASAALHVSLGFEPVGTFRDVGWKLGMWRDVAFWQKRFATDAAGPIEPKLLTVE